MEYIRLNVPIDKNKSLSELKAGDNVLINGFIYTARDAAHKRFISALDEGSNLPINIEDQFIYYVGPAPAKPGYAAGPAGPTTSYRMDAYTPQLLKLGLKGMIGKGLRSNEVINAIKEYGAIYFGAVGGAAALISKSIIKVEVVCYEDLGAEAVHKLYIENFPAIVVIDSYGNNLYESEPNKYKF